MMKMDTVMDPTLIAAPNSNQNAEDERDPELKQTKKGNQWYFGIKAQSAWTRIPVDGVAAVDVNCGMSAPVVRARVARRASSAPQCLETSVVHTPDRLAGGRARSVHFKLHLASS